MWLIAWEDVNGEKLWEVVSGYDTMQERVYEITKSGILNENVIVGEIPPAFFTDYDELIRFWRITNVQNKSIS